MWEMLQNIAVWYEHIQKIFREVLSELFLDKWLCEETELQLFLIKILNDSEEVYFVSQSGKEIRIDCAGAKDYKEAVRDYVEHKYNKNNEFYVLQESDSLNNEDWQIRFVFVLFSECLRSNKGRLLLVYVLENFMKRMIDLFIDHQKKEFITDEGYVKLILENAERDMSACLERLYLPFDFQSVIGLSGEYYEKSECRANLVFLPKAMLANIKENDWSFHFCLNDQEQLDLVYSKTRLFRKLMQITQNDLCLILAEESERKSFHAVGICDGNTLDRLFPTLPYIKVKIRKHMQWDMLLGSVYIVTYANGHYRINYPMQESYLRKKLSLCFGQAEYQNLIELILESVNQKHGTMLVVMEGKNAENEVNKLNSLNYGFKSGFLKCNKEDINHLNAIDGSVILDLEGNIRGIGMILDGVQWTKGNLAKGSRHNSALKYQAYLQKEKIQGMIVVVSEDGSIELHTSEEDSERAGAEY